MSTEQTAPRVLSVASWNVEHFGRTSSAKSARDPRHPIEFLSSQNADVVAVCDMMPNYNFFVTEGAEVDVRGWADGDFALDWTETYSDHSLSYFEVEAA